MSYADHAALQNSDLNPFLFADVGTEPNGSTLTMLSVIARLGKDPWVEAARWAKLPKPIAIDRVMTTISDMPLFSLSASETKTVAARLVMLLPAGHSLPGLNTATLPSKTSLGAVGTSLGVAGMPRWLPMALLACVMLLGLAYNLRHAPSVAPRPSTITQTKAPAPGGAQ